MSAVPVAVSTIAWIVVGYGVLIVVVLALLRAAKSADVRADREHEELERARRPGRRRRFRARKTTARRDETVRRTG